MSRSLSQTGESKRRFSWPTGTPQIAALLVVLLVDSLVAPHFFQIIVQDGRLFGSPIDILNRAAPVALLAIGMTLVIATGGGCVTQPRNYPMLHQNGVIFWLKRDISKLPTNGRPLSQTNPLDAMFAKRAPMYAAFADHAVSNDGSAEETVAAILSIMEEPI